MSRSVYPYSTEGEVYKNKLINLFIKLNPCLVNIRFAKLSFIKLCIPDPLKSTSAL